MATLRFRFRFVGSEEWFESSMLSAAETAAHALMLYRGYYPADVRAAAGHGANVWRAAGKGARKFPAVFVETTSA